MKRDLLRPLAGPAVVDPVRLRAARERAALRSPVVAPGGLPLLPGQRSGGNATGPRVGDDGSLVIENLGVRYGDQVAVVDADVLVAPGTCIAVLGANGAGKTSLLNAISGLQRPVTGRVRFAGRDLGRLTAHEVARLGVCHIPEGRGIFPDLSVADNLRMTLGGDRDALERALDRFPVLRNRAAQRAGSLSGGEQQMLALAPAVATTYRLLLVDELSLGLAPVIVDELFAILADIRATGVSIIVVEQFADRALALADTAYIMRKGRVVLVAPAGDLRGRDEVLRDIYLGAGRGSARRPSGKIVLTRQGGSR